jgi:hypothetical protein
MGVLAVRVLFCGLPLHAQMGMWTWIAGDSICNPPGNFGVQGTASPLNTPPGVYMPYNWIDHQGNFWIYGGRNYSTGYPFYGDLWKFDVQLEQWIWIKGNAQSNVPPVFGIKGVPDPANIPGSAGFSSPTWVDANGDLWLFVGGAWGGDRNNLWKYHIATNEWTWMTGATTVFQQGIYGTTGVSSPSNTPGAREYTNCSWIDTAGNFWLFGGLQNMNPGTGYRNDLWKYDPSINEWTWMMGADTSSQYGVYGVKGVPDPLNMPGAHGSSCKWTDAAGNFWMMGGAGCGASAVGYMDDVWRLNPNTLVWTWMGGSNNPNAPVVYGSLCDENMLNTPGEMSSNTACAQDSSNNFWVSGGFSYLSNDLWHYNIVTNQWARIAGDSMAFAQPVYGIKGVPGPLNHPRGKAGAVSWYSNGNYWLFGGSINIGGLCSYNDMWKFTFDTACSFLTGTGIAPAGSNNEQLNLFPNPNAGVFTVTLPGGNAGKVNTEVFDIPGKRLFYSQDNSSATQIKITLPRISEGMYIIRVTVNGKTFSSCFIIQR